MQEPHTDGLPKPTPATPTTPPRAGPAPAAAASPSTRGTPTPGTAAKPAAAAGAQPASPGTAAGGTAQPAARPNGNPAPTSAPAGAARPPAATPPRRVAPAGGAPNTGLLAAGHADVHQPAAAPAAQPAARVVARPVTAPAPRPPAPPQGPYEVKGKTIDDLKELRDAIAAGRRVRLHKCRVTVPVDLSTEQAREAVFFDDCRFERDVDLSGCRFAKGLSLDRSRFRGTLTLSDATVDGTLSMWRVFLRRYPKARPSVHTAATLHDWSGLTVTGRFDARDLHAAGGINLYHLRLDDDLDLSGAQLRWGMNGVAMAVVQAELGSNVFVGPSRRRTRVRGLLHLHGKIAGSVSFSGARLSVVDVPTPGGKALLMFSAEVGGGITFEADGSGTRFECDGQMDLRGRFGTMIGIAGARLSVAKVPAANATAVDLARADVGGAVFFRADAHGNRCECDGKLDLRASRIGGQLNLNGARLSVADMPRSNGLALDLEDAKVGGSVFFTPDASHRFECDGQIDLRATVDGGVTFRGARLRVADLAHGDGTAVMMEMAHVRGHVMFFGEGSHRFECVGQIDLRTKVGGALYFGGARLSVANIPAAHGVAVTLAKADVGESIRFGQDDAGNRFECDGALNIQAKVGGQVRFNGTRVSLKDLGLPRTPKTRAVSFRGASISGGVELRNAAAAQHEVLGGGIDATYLQTAYVQIEGLVDGELDLTFAAVDKNVDLSMADPLQVRGGLRLDYARIGRLEASRTCLGQSGGGSALSAHHCRVDGEAHFKGCMPCPCEMPASAAAAADADGNAAVSPESAAQPCAPAPKSAAGGPAQWLLNSAEIKGDLSFAGAHLPGGLSIEDARVEGEFNLTGARIDGDLNMQSARINGRAFGDDRSDSGPYPCASGAVNLRYATVTDLAIRFGDGADGREPTSVDLTGTELGRLSVTGTPKALPQLDFDSCRFKTLEVAGLPDSPPPHTWHRCVIPLLVAAGLWALTLYQVGYLWPAAAAFTLTALYAVVQPKDSYRDAIRRGVWLGMAGIIAARVVHEQLWAVGIALGALVLLTFSAVSWARRRKPTHDVSALLAMLQHARFRRGFYMSVEGYLRREGNDVGADEVFVSRRKRETRVEPGEERTPPSLALRVWQEVLDLMFGYGVRVERLVHLFVLLLLLNWAIFSNPLSVERPLTYVQPRAAAANAPTPTAFPVTPAPVNPWPDDGGTGERAGEDPWGQGHGFFMAVRLAVPLIELVAESDWQPASRRMSNAPGWAPWMTYENCAAAMMVANLILVPLLIAGATGFLRKKEGGGGLGVG